MASEFFIKSSLFQTEGAGKTGRRLAPMVRVQQKSTRQNHRFSRIRPAFPARWCYGLYVISPVTRLCCHRRLASSLRNLTPAQGRQDHTTSPYASAALVRRSSRVHRIPASRVVTIARTPLASRRDAREDRFDLPDAASAVSCMAIMRNLPVVQARTRTRLAPLRLKGFAAAHVPPDRRRIRRRNT